ncbi:unnamed protein product [Lymnaea stagnalis]|uniref:PDZ domain-containing protein n=1 Tax=Lymnaea stagnalis TaxID=6523 RepID=A0AAV2IAN5_LYMST
MSREYVQHFQRLTLALLTDKEQDVLHRALSNYQRTRDISRLAKVSKELLNTPERGKLLAYIRAPMSRSERSRFDKLLGIAGYDNLAMVETGRPEFLGRITTPPGSVTLTERFVTVYGSRGESMGFSIRGGSEFGLGIYVSNVKLDSPAAHAGLQVGDHIITANGVDFHCVANSGAVKVLSSAALLNLVVIRTGRVPEWKIAKERVLWYDVSQGRVVASPPLTERPTTNLPHVLVERKVVITVNDDSDFIGLNIRGGSEYNIGIYISRLDPGGLAARAGLSPGDQIVRVNDTEFLYITHTDAVDALRSSAHLIITVRSVGKFPVFKELCAEYTWSDGSTYNTVVGRTKVVTGPAANSSRQHIQRTRARESSIDLTPLRYARAGSSQHLDDTDLDNIQAIEDLDQALEVESKLFYPGDKDILFRRNHEDTWQDIESIKDNYSRVGDVSHTWSARDSDIHSSDASDRELDYTTFLEQAMQQKDTKDRARMTNGKALSAPQPETETVIETVIEEEGVTSFSSSPSPKSPGSQYSGSDVFNREIAATDRVYAQVNDLTGKHPAGAQARTQARASVSSVSSDSSPIYATVNKSTKRLSVGSHAVVVNGSAEPDEETLASQLQLLEARKSSLSSWELSRVAGGAGETPHSSEAMSDVSSPDSDKQKYGTWNSLKKKVKGSFRIKGSGNKKRTSLTHDDVFMASKTSTPMGSLRQKGVFERSFGSQILNTPITEQRYNLMGMLEDHARLLLKEDECAAVIRHIHTYHDNKELDRLMELLFTILDKPEKRALLSDVRNVIAPNQLKQFDILTARVNLNSPNTPLNNGEHQEPKYRPAKPARSRPTAQTNGKTGFYDLTSRHGNSAADRVPSFSSDDFRDIPSHLEVVIVEEETVRESPVVREGEEIVYISKHKMNLGLELIGGRNHSDDKAIRVKNVKAGGAASDDQRLQPGVEITSIDGTSVEGMSKEEAEALLQRAFIRKTPTNLGIHIRH